MQIHLDPRGMAPAIHPEDFLAVEVYPDRPTGLAREYCGAHLVRERVGLASKTTAHKGPVDVDLVHRDVKDISQSPVNVVWDLLRGVQSQPPRRVPICNYGMGLGESVIGTGEQPVRIVAGDGVGGHALDVTELLEDPLLDVRRADVVLASVMNRLGGVFKPLPHVVDCFELLVLDLDETHCLPRRSLVDGGDAGNQVTHVPHLLASHRVLVLGHGKHAESPTSILPGGHSEHPGQLHSRRDIDGQHPSVVVLRTNDPANQLAGKADVVAVLRLTRHLPASVDQSSGSADG